MTNSSQNASQNSVNAQPIEVCSWWRIIHWMHHAMSLNISLIMYVSPCFRVYGLIIYYLFIALVNISLNIHKNSFIHHCISNIRRVSWINIFALINEMRVHSWDLHWWHLAHQLLPSLANAEEISNMSFPLQGQKNIGLVLMLLITSHILFFKSLFHITSSFSQ